MIAPEEWARVSDLFDRLLPVPAAERVSHLAGEPPAVQRQVLELLDALTLESGRFGGHAFDLLQPGGGMELLAEAPPGTRIGPYEVVRELGRGGMGVVVEAFRADDDFRKRVAIKRLGFGTRSGEWLRRFRRERRILARLEHPHIAALLDGGVTEDGVPYFALEFVEGTPIDQYVDAQRVPLDGRLRMLLQVCDAMQYAHQRLVVHRDLKPGNILVTGDGVVKLLDFGVATVLGDDDSTDALDHTVAGTLAYTPAWASPEQLRGEPLTTACDIHGLGLVCYQVIAGRHPFRSHDATAAEVRRRLLDAPPPPTGQGRDLDAIVQRALAKSPEDRYPSAALLAEDLERFLDGRPLRTRPGTRAERLRKFVRRHRAAVTGAVAATLIAGVGLAATLWQARYAQVQRERAEAFGSFVRRMLSAPDPTRLGRDARVIDLLGATVARLEAGEVGDPVTRADIERTLGTTYTALGAHDTAATLLTAAVTRSRRALGASHLETLRSVLALAQLEATRGRGAVADSLFRQAIASARTQRPAADADLATGLVNHGNLLYNIGRQREAEPLLREALSLLSAPLGTGPEQAGELRVNALNSLGLVREHLGDPSGAKARYRDAAKAAAAAGASGAVLQVGPLANLANVLKLEDSLALADSLQVLAVARARQAYGPHHAVVGATLTGLGDVRRRRGNVAGAEQALREALAVLAVALPPQHLQQAPPLSLLGLVLCEAGRPAEGEPPLRRALAIREAQLPAGHWFIHNVESALSVCLRAAGRPDAARAIARRGYEGLRLALGADHPRTREAAARWAALGGDTVTPPPARP